MRTARLDRFPATFYEVVEPFTVYIRVGNAESNTHVGRLQALDPVWRETTANAGSIICSLPGGTFISLDNSDTAYAVSPVISDKHLFERGFDTKTEMWPVDLLHSVSEQHFTYLHQETEDTFSFDQLREIGAMRHGHGGNWLLPINSIV